MPWEASTASQRRRKIMEWFIWMLVLVAAGFAVVLMAIGLYGLMLAALTVGVPAAFMSGNPGLGFALLTIDIAIIAWVWRDDSPEAILVIPICGGVVLWFLIVIGAGPVLIGAVLVLAAL